MAKLMNKRLSPGEIKFLITQKLVRRLDFKSAHDVAYEIYADIVAPALDQERRAFEEAQRAKDAGLS